MADHSKYESHLSHSAAAFVVALPRKQQALVLDLAEKIAFQPSTLGDFQTIDAAGHQIENLLIDSFIFTYWVDHATREVRITEIDRV